MSAAWKQSTAVGNSTADSVRRRILDQHVELRQLLAAGLEHVNAALAGQQWAHVPLRMLIGVTRRAFVEHLAEEEELLVGILENDVPLGPQRAQRLREEHARQLDEMDELCAMADVEDVADLSARFRRLAGVLGTDMDHEEREVLTPDIVRDDGVVIDQCGG